MRASTVVLYNRELWQLSYSYRMMLVLLRMVELGFVALRYFSIRVPVLLIWTRLPGLRGRRPPWVHLASALGPLRVRPPVTVGKSELGEKTLGEIGAREELDIVLESAKKRVAGGIPTWRIIVGGVMRGLIIDLGSTFIKFAQIASMRPEMPGFLKDELALVQDRMPAIDFRDVRKIIRQELGKDLEEVFEYVDEQPIAAGSLAQVTRAKLRKEQTEVALKIQRPYLEAITTIDVVLIIDVLLPSILLFLPLFRRNMDISIFTLSFRKSLRKEIDFFLEGRVQDTFYRVITTNPLHKNAWKIAGVNFDYTTKRLITMDLVKDFCRADRLLEMPPDKLWPLLTTRHPVLEEYERQIGSTLTLHVYQAAGAILIDMLSDWGLFHGDLHLGNLYGWLPEDEQPRIFLCDWGMVADWSPEQQEIIDELLPRLITGDGYRAAEGIQWAMSVEYPDAWRNMSKESLEATKEKFAAWGERRIVHATSNEWWQMKMKYMGTFSLTADLLYTLWSNPGLKIPDWIWLLFKCFAYIEELGITMWSDYDGANLFRPTIWKHMKKGALKELDSMNVITMDLEKVGEKLWGPVEGTRFRAAVRENQRLFKLLR